MFEFIRLVYRIIVDVLALINFMKKDEEKPKYTDVSVDPEKKKKTDPGYWIDPTNNS